jgi:hypothetical protein
VGAGFGAIAAGAMLVAAQFPPPALPPQQQPIVVEGKLKDTVSRFVEQLTQTMSTDQIGRWYEEVCPTIYGMDPNQAAFMQDRIAELAKSVKLQTNDRGCVTDLAIIMTPDAEGISNYFRRKYPIILRTDGWNRLRRFVDSSSPIRWISVTDECGSGGCSLPNSHIHRATRPGIVLMIVIIDARKVEGRTLGEISDYVGLVALSNPPLDKGPRPNSILGMFDEPRTIGAPAAALTDFDRTFLAGLYRAPIDMGANAQRIAIERQMRKSLEKPPRR